MLAQCDDHEVIYNWYWEKRLDADKRYAEKSAAVLAACGQRAFREYMPLSGGLEEPMKLARRFSFGPRLDLFRIDMRSFRGANGDNRETSLGPRSALLGSAQVEWLKAALKDSKATWKIIAADMPLGLVVYDDWRTRKGSEAVANDDNGAPLGRELEIADLLAFIKREDIATSTGSRPTCIMPRRTATILTAHPSPTSCRSTNLSRARSAPPAPPPPHSTTPSAPRSSSCTPPPPAASMSRRPRAAVTSAMSGSMARAAP